MRQVGGSAPTAGDFASIRTVGISPIDNLIVHIWKLENWELEGKVETFLSVAFKLMVSSFY
jgi:hypothetical protein